MPMSQGSSTKSGPLVNIMGSDSAFFGLGRGVVETLLSSVADFGSPTSVTMLQSMALHSDLPEFVLESEAKLLPGEPPARSISLALPVRIKDVESMAWTFGDASWKSPESTLVLDFMQILLVETDEPITRSFLSRLNSLRSLAGAIPGYMAHSVGDQTSARVHADLMSAGFGLEQLAAAHVAAMRRRGFSGQVFVAVGVPAASTIDLIAPFASELSALVKGLSAQSAVDAGSGDGCGGRTCGDCDERNVCDKVRAVLKAHGRGAVKLG